MCSSEGWHRLGLQPYGTGISTSGHNGTRTNDSANNSISNNISNGTSVNTALAFRTRRAITRPLGLSHRHGPSCHRWLDRYPSGCRTDESSYAEAYGDLAGDATACGSECLGAVEKWTSACL